MRGAGCRVQGSGRRSLSFRDPPLPPVLAPVDGVRVLGAPRSVRVEARGHEEIVGEAIKKDPDDVVLVRARVIAVPVQ